MDLTLITASMPQRLPKLRELLDSVQGQTVTPAAHLIEVSPGPLVPKLNRLISMVQTDFYVQVDDDDLLLPNHVEVLGANLTADVVWTWCNVDGRNWSPNEPYQPGVLQQRNYIPSNCAIRTSMALGIGGHRDVSEYDYHDHDFLRRAESAGATFLNIPTITWTYRFHGGNTGGHRRGDAV